MKTLKQHIKLNKDQYKILSDYAHYSNNLYNYALYVTKQFYKETGKYLGYSKLEKEVKSNENYKLLPSQSAQQILRLIDQNYRAFFALLRKKNLGQYNDSLKEPKFKKKGGVFNTIFTFQNISIKKNCIYFVRSKRYKELNSTKLNIDFSYKLNGKIKQIVFKPYNNGQYFKMFIVYEETKKEINYDLNKDAYLSIDLGINNLASCFDRSGPSFIMNGKPLKSYNRYYNKTKAEVQSELKLKNNKMWSKKLENMTESRENYIENYFNQFVNKIVKHCLNHKIQNVIMGYNEGWKQDLNLGKKFNQKFAMIPYLKFKLKLENKCSEYGISFKFVEESYTSKCSFLDHEKLGRHSNYLGSRVKRGLFKSSSGKLINADINGAANILRKVIGDTVYGQPILDLMFNPAKINIF